MPVTSPSERNWWDVPLGIHEKIWLTVVVLVGVGMFVMMPVWHVFGDQNPSTTSYRVSPDGYFEKVTQWAKEAERVEQGVKPLGQDAYIVALRYAWFPNPLVLEAGVPYRIHLSSKDVNHGFSVHKDGEASQKVNFQVVPGYEYVLTMEFPDPGTYHIVCQEYCGLGHQNMVGKIIVEEGS